MENRAVYLAIGALGFVVALSLSACGAGDSGGSQKEAVGQSASALPDFADLEVRSCPTEIGLRLQRTPPPPTVQAAIPPSVARGLVAYRDAAGSILVGPRGWECEAGIGSDHSERISAFPPGDENPAEPPFYPGEVISLQLFTDCKQCIAAGVCALFPRASIVRRYGSLGGSQCPRGGLHERVIRLSPETAIFADPPELDGTGTGSGGRAPSVGAMSFSEATGMRKVSCTLSSAPDRLCARIVGVTMTAVTAQ
jgi:hypothetical protein